jgi:hypothetical protein
MSYVTRRGRRIEVVYLPDANAPPKKKTKKRKPFKAEWVQFPTRWIEVLQGSDRVSAYRLALAILVEAFKRKIVGGEVVLSSEVTGMARTTRLQAAKELVALGLIDTKQIGKEALRVSDIYY